MMRSMCIAAAGVAAALGAGAPAAAAGGPGAELFPLPRAVVASAAISDAIERFADTGVFRLDMDDDDDDGDGGGGPGGGKCIANYHPLEHTVWDYRPPPTPDCPGQSAAAQCISEWFNRWRADLNQVHEAWEDAYCYCVCCPEEGGFDGTEECLQAMIEVFEPEFQRLINQYNAFDPTSCCPVER